MLFFISWGRFLTGIFLLTALYYTIILLLFYRNKVISWLRKKPTLMILGLLTSIALQAQDGNQGINQANTMIRGYFDSGTQLLYAIGSLLALVGAVKVFRELNAGHQQDATRAAVGWFSSCIFLVLVATVIRSFFGL